MLTLGTLALPGGAGVIWQPTPTRTPTPAPIITSTRPPIPRSPIAPPTTVIGDPVIVAPTTFGPATGTTGTTGTTGGTTGTAGGGVTSPGATDGTPTDPNAALATLLAGLFQSQPVSPTMAPVTFADPGTATVDATASPNKGVIILVILAAIAGIWYYVKHRGKRAA